ncbi:hypothetical protein BC834DRAFT_1032479 [Gloeopeniophorella convolvens]|nr:hypothetical protein BC834DRAFT_1032479 [Gloeopeniophorella convolvens]
MDASTPLLHISRLRLTRQSQLSPLDDDLSTTPTAGPSRLHALHDENEDNESTPRLPISSSLPSMFAMTEDTPAARLRALLAQVPNTSSASRTQLLREPTPSLPSDRESDFDPPPKWAASSTSSVRESVSRIFAHALRSPGDTPRKGARRNSIDMSEVEDSPRVDRVVQERSRHKAKRMSISDEELERSKGKTPMASSHAANIEALRSRIMSSRPSQLDGSISDASNTSNDTAALLHEMRGSTASEMRNTGASMQTMQLSAQLQSSHSNLLDQDSEMQRAMGTGDSFGGESSKQVLPPSFPPIPKTATAPLAVRPRASIMRAGSLTDNKLSANVTRRTSGGFPQRAQDDLASSASSVTGDITSAPSTPPRDRRDSYHHHRASHSQTGSPLPEFPRQRHDSVHSAGSSRSSSRAESNSSIADFRDRMKDTEKERQRERERAWNKPSPSRVRINSQTSITNHSTRPGSAQIKLTPETVRISREHSRPSSPSGSIQSHGSEDEEVAEPVHGRELNGGAVHPKPNRHLHRSVSPLPGPSSRSRTRSLQSNTAEPVVNGQVRSRHLRRNSSISSLQSQDSSRASSPAGSVHDIGEDKEEEEVVHERERNWGARQPKWTHTSTQKRALSPNPAASHSRVRKQSLESDSSAPGGPPLTRSPNSHLKHKRNVPSASVPPQRLSPQPASLSPEIHKDSKHSVMPTSPRSPQPNGRAHDKPMRVPPHLSPRPTSPIPPANGGADVKATQGSPPYTSRFGWQFPRSRPQLPEFGAETESSSPERSPSPVHRPPSHLSGSTSRSHIPVRSPGKVPRVEMGKSGEAKPFTRGHKRATTEFAEANGAIPPRIHFEPAPEPETESETEPEVAVEHEATNVEALRESDESSQDAPTPVARPIEIPPHEQPQPPAGDDPFAHSERTPNDASSMDIDTSAPAVPPPLDTTPSFELSTPPRRASLSSSKIEFKTPSPPRGLPDLPGPPLSSEDETDTGDLLPERQGGENQLNLTTMKTPRPPGAWAATPAPAPVPARSQTPQPASSSAEAAKSARARSNSLPQPSFAELKPSLVTPVSAFSRASTLPSRTPAPPGAWMATPGSLRRKALMKVRFEAVSDSTASDADAGAKKDESEESLPVADWNTTPLARPQLNASDSMSEPSFNDVKSSSPAQVPSASANGNAQEPGAQDAKVPKTPTTSPPRRRHPRRSPSVRLVDEYGRAQEDPPVTPARRDAREQSASMRMPGGGPLKTPRTTSVRMLDAMGREVEDASEHNDSEDTVTETRYSRQEALARMKRAVADLQEGLSAVDSASGAALDDPRLGELHELSKAARDLRVKLATSLQQAQVRPKYGSLKESMRRSRFLPNFLPELAIGPWNSWLFVTIFVLQFVLFLVMYRMSKIHAKQQFLTTYFDPFYAELHLHPNKPELNYDANLFSFIRRSALEPSQLERLGVQGPLDYITHTISAAIAEAQRYIWNTWGVINDDQVKAWPPT